MRNPITHETKVFGIGMNKTGTSSLGRCLERLGFLPLPPQATINNAGLVDAVLERKDYSKALEFAEDYRAFEDRPWNVWEMYQRLDDRFSDSRFVLTIRDPETWWRSVHRWLTVVKPNTLDRYLHHLRVTSFDHDSFVRAYNENNQNVIDYFKKQPDKLLVIDFELGDGWTKICAFLDRPVPSLAFPHANRQRNRGHQPEKTGSPRLRTSRCFSCDYQFDEQVSPADGKLTLSKKVSNAIASNRNRTMLRMARNEKLARWRVERLKARWPGLHIDNLAAICSFFNAYRSPKRLENYRRFNDALRLSGIPLLTVELAVGDHPHQLDEVYGDVIRVRTKDIMWHKERLLNIGIRELLARGYEKIVWLDADIEFMDARYWPWYVAAGLEEYRLCQVFSRALVRRSPQKPARLGVSSVKYYRDRGRLTHQLPEQRGLTRPRRYPMGYTGYGWAARGELLRQMQLYDRALIGGGDKMIFVASFPDDKKWKEQLAGLVRSSWPPCPRCGHESRSMSYEKHYLDWARKWAELVAGDVGYADLTITDMYHGSRASRLYQDRRNILLGHAYDPQTDIVANQDSCWEWASPTTAMHEHVRKYFRLRQDA